MNRWNMSESIDPFVNYHVQQFAYCSLTTTWCLIGTCILGFRLLGDFDTSVNEAYVNPLSHTFINHDMQYSPIHSFGIHHFKSNLCILLHIYIDRYRYDHKTENASLHMHFFTWFESFHEPTQPKHKWQPEITIASEYHQIMTRNIWAKPIEIHAYS